jgi:hypothetical protein
MLLLSAAGTIASLVSLVVGVDPNRGFGMGLTKSLFGGGFVVSILANSLGPKIGPQPQG